MKKKTKIGKKRMKTKTWKKRNGKNPNLAEVCVWGLGVPILLFRFCVESITLQIYIWEVLLII